MLFGGPGDGEGNTQICCFCKQLNGFEMSSKKKEKLNLVFYV